MLSLRKIVTFLSWFVLLGSSSYAATITGTVEGPDGAPFEGRLYKPRTPALG
jgi:hypothetical protein